MSQNKSATPSKKRWYHYIPDPMVLIFLILVFVWILTWIIPAGEFDRTEMNGRMAVVADSFHTTEPAQLSPLALFFAIPKGLVAAANIVFITLIAGGLFHLLSASGALENLVGTVVNRIGSNRRTLLVWVMTYVFGLLGVTVGYENNIALVPIAILIGLAIGGDLIVGLGIAIGGIGFGFATSPINPFTVGVSQDIAEIPLFSGVLLRSLFAVAVLALMAHHTSRYLHKIQQYPEKSLTKGLSTEGMKLSKPIDEYRIEGKDWKVLLTFITGLALLLYGVFAHGWYINEIAGIFLMIAVISGLLLGMSAKRIAEYFVEGASAVIGGALLIGLARAIQVLLEQGNIGDTIINALAASIADLPLMLSTILMTLVHGIINVFIPSGSGQAMVTMPIMIPLSDLIGMTRQTAILAFQVGDGFTNMVAPTSGGTLAMLALAGVSYDRWVRFMFPMVIKAYVLSWVFLAIAVAINWSGTL